MKEDFMRVLLRLGDLFIPFVPSIGYLEAMSVTEKSFNRDLLLRENLAIQRTILANQTTFLSFLRTSMYFLVAGLSIKNLLQVEGSIYYQVPFYIISGSILVFGIVNYFRHRRKIELSKVHLGDYKLEYLKSGPKPGKT